MAREADTASDKLAKSLQLYYNQRIASLAETRTCIAGAMQVKREQLAELNKCFDEGSHSPASALLGLSECITNDIVSLEAQLTCLDNKVENMEPPEHRPDSKLAQNLLLHGANESDEMFANVAYEMARAQSLYRLPHMSDSVCSPKMQSIAADLHRAYPNVPWSVLWTRIRTHIHPLLKMEALKRQ